MSFPRRPYRYTQIIFHENTPQNGVTCTRKFVLNQDLLDASDKPRHVGGGSNCQHALVITNLLVFQDPIWDTDVSMQLSIPFFHKRLHSDDDEVRVTWVLMHALLLLYNDL